MFLFICLKFGSIDAASTMDVYINVFVVLLALVKYITTSYTILFPLTNSCKCVVCPVCVA